MTGRVGSLHVYPIKSCAGTTVDEFTLTPHGPEHDRDFLVVDSGGRFLTPRPHPRVLPPGGKPAAGIDDEEVAGAFRAARRQGGLVGGRTRAALGPGDVQRSPPTSPPP